MLISLNSVSHSLTIFYLSDYFMLLTEFKHYAYVALTKLVFSAYSVALILQHLYSKKDNKVPNVSIEIYVAQTIAKQKRNRT